MTYDNREKAQGRARKGTEEHAKLLMATRRGLPEHTGEAEPVLVYRDQGNVVLVLDDGEQLELDALELAAAIKPRLQLAA
jgi:hypothetical protein